MSETRKELSRRQKDALDIIKASLERDGRPPTYRELADAMGLRGINAAADHIKALVRKGYLAPPDKAGISRGFRLTVRGKGVVEVPILRERASWPLGPEDYNGVLRLDESLLPDKPLVARRSESYVEVAVADSACRVGSVILLETKDGRFTPVGPVVLTLRLC